MFVLMIAVALGIPILIAAATFSWKTLVPIDTRRRTGKKLGESAGHVAMIAAGMFAFAAIAMKWTLDCVSSAVLDPLLRASYGVIDYAKNAFTPKTGLLFAGGATGGITYDASTADRLRDDGGGTRSVMKMLMSTFSGATSSTNANESGGGRDQKPTNYHSTSRGDPTIVAGTGR